jgi:hypothetical protein
VCVVNFHGNIVIDTLIKPWSAKTDLRESITGIKKDDIKHAPSYPRIAPIVSKSNLTSPQLKRILNDRVVVGHNILEDLPNLKLDSRCSFLVRDIADFH